MNEKVPSALAKGTLFIETWKEVTTLESVISFVSEVGFPIDVTMYLLLHSIETKPEAVIASIRLLPQEIESISLHPSP